MRYFQFGTGPKTMVILPGLSVQSVMNAADAVAGAYKPMAEDFTVTVFDRREELPASYSVREMARDTAEAIRTLRLCDLYLFGASQGGMIALELAAGYPQLVRKLALGSTAARMGEAQCRTLNGWVALAERNDAPGLFLDFGARLYPDRFFQLCRPALAAAAQTVTEAELARFVTLAQGAKGFDVTDRLNDIQCPVLVLGAADDAVLGPDAARELLKYRTKQPPFEFYLYDGYGHAAFDTAPDYKKRLLRFFLK